jgi:D-glycero-alpha-D-manno-heptose-7-phosphate kinase
MQTLPITARAPTRIDFVGGWTDVQPFCDEEPGLVVNAAFGLYARVTAQAGEQTRDAEIAFANAARKRFGLENVDIHIASDAPVGSGLGGSGAVGVALVGALSAYAQQALARGETAELAHRIELEDLGVLGGKQDQYAAAFGGFLALTFVGTTVSVEQIPLRAERVAEWQARSIVVYTGQSRLSGDIHAQVQKAYRARVPATLDALATIRRVAREFRAALGTGPLDALGEWLNANWRAQKQLHAATTNAHVDELFRLALDAGALGGKALGAGGGGCLYFLAREGESTRVQEALRGAGAVVLPMRFDLEGLRVESNAVA